MATVKIQSGFNTFVADKADTSYVLNEGKALSIASDDYGIDGRAGADNQTYLINGGILYSKTVGLQAGTGVSKMTGADNCAITIGTTGQINVELTAVGVYGNHAAITNNGILATDMTAGNAGIYLEGDGGKITNNGLISARSGIVVIGDADKIINTGNIISESAITSLTGSDDTLKIVNSGRLTSTGVSAFSGSAGEDTIVNSGQIDGSIWLSGGDDIFINHGGHMNGTVHGGLDDDTYIIDSKLAQLQENFGEGYDRVRSAVSWTLGDNFEEARLTGKKDINLTGNDGSSFLRGNAGNNKIIGDMGADSLTGGRGNDILTGGDGVNSGDIADFFDFKNHCGKDVITDFQDGMDKIYLQSYDGIDSFADLAGHIKQSGDDVVITLHDGDMLTLRHMDKVDLSAADFHI